MPGTVWSCARSFKSWVAWRVLQLVRALWAPLRGTWHCKVRRCKAWWVWRQWLFGKEFERLSAVAGLVEVCFLVVKDLNWINWAGLIVNCHEGCSHWILDKCRVAAKLSCGAIVCPKRHLANAIMEKRMLPAALQKIGVDCWLDIWRNDKGMQRAWLQTASSHLVHPVNDVGILDTTSRPFQHAIPACALTFDWCSLDPEKNDWVWLSMAC